MMNDDFEMPRKKRKLKNRYTNNYGLDIYADINAEEEQEKELSEEEYQKQRTKAMDMSLRYLGYKARSVSKMHEYMKKKEIDAEVAAEVIDRLKEYGYCNDRELSDAILISETQNKLLGLRRATMRMKREGIEETLIEYYLENGDEDVELSNAKHWVDKMLPKIKGEAFARRNKLTSRLASRGFSYSIINTALREVEFEDNL